MNVDISSLVDHLLSTQIEKLTVDSTDPLFVRLMGSDIVVPKNYFEPAWGEREWLGLVQELLRLLPPGSAHAFTIARKSRGKEYQQLYERIGMYCTCPPVVQQAMFFERRDVQQVLEYALAEFHRLMTPRQLDGLLRRVLARPWKVELQTKLYRDIKRVVRQAELVCVPGAVIQFWNGEGVGLLPSERYVIFAVLLFGEGFDYATTFSDPTPGILQAGLRTVWHLKTQRTRTTPPKSPRPTSSA